MQLGMVGLGRMGGNMVRRLLKAGHECFVFDPNPEPRKELAKLGAKPAASLAELVKSMSKPCAIWVMVPAGAPTENTICELSELMRADDTVIDGGNSYFKDDVRRSK